MEKLDEKSAAQFISALVKSVQALCHGYLDFHNGIEIIGHINLSVDKESSLHYILEEKVCKSEENSTMFVSNSFYAQKKAELQAKSKGCEPVLSSSNSVHIADVSDTDDTVSPSTSGASETDPSPSNKSVSSPVKRIRNTNNNDSVRSKAKTYRSAHPGQALAGLDPESSQMLVNTSSTSLDLSNTSSVRALQCEALMMDNNILLAPCSESRDVVNVNDIGVSLEGSVLEAVGEASRSSSGHAAVHPDDRDGDLEDVTFIKKEFLEDDEEPTEHSCGYQFGTGSQHTTASSSYTLPDSLVYSSAHAHPACARSTYVPSAHSLAPASAHHYCTSLSSALPHQQLAFDIGTEGQKPGLGQQVSRSHSGHLSFMLGEASFTPPLAHQPQSPLAHSALGLSVLDLSIKTEPGDPRDPEFLHYNCEQKRKKNSILFSSCPDSPRTEESRQKAKERSKEYRMKQKIHRMTDSTYDMVFRNQVAERKRRQRMRERIKKLKPLGVQSFSIAN